MVPPPVVVPVVSSAIEPLYAATWTGYDMNDRAGVDDLLARDLVDGAYVMPPFNRFELALEVIRGII